MKRRAQSLETATKAEEGEEEENIHRGSFKNGEPNRWRLQRKRKKEKKKKLIGAPLSSAIPRQASIWLWVRSKGRIFRLGTKQEVRIMYHFASAPCDGCNGRLHESSYFWTFLQ